jgi:predicted unusual protein kinase regulating ubiquinone biosynthesis (AarF/ABC1/UbiB family)
LSDHEDDDKDHENDRRAGHAGIARVKKKGNQTRVPTSRAERLARIGMLTTEFALSGAAEGVKRVFGAGASDANVFFNPKGAERLARRLSRMRGATMKIGQMLSLLDDEMLPKEFAEALAILRDSADSMPESQVRESLVNEYGTEWWKKFESFDFEPIAAASIGQVHTAITRDGRELALKIQYPGVAESIDSDVSNMATALKAARILPIGLDVDSMVEVAKTQLKQEADYLAEAAYLKRYRALLGDDPRYQIPDLVDEFTTPRILAMERLFGVPLEDLAGVGYSQQQRDQVGARLYELLFRELFQFRLMQTDPNFSNYLLLADSDRIGLLDFGSTSEVAPLLSSRYRELFSKLYANDHAGVAAAILAIGYLLPEDSDEMKDRMADLFEVVFEPLTVSGVYDFNATGIASRAQEMSLALAFKHGYMRLPPPETLFLHRKLDGTLLLCSRIRARVDVSGILQRVLAETEPPQG